jgi:hypothetical protein
VLVAQGDLPGALDAYRKRLAIAETLAARDPGNTPWQRDISISLGRMADTLLQMHRQAEARPLAERALKLPRAAVTRFPNDPPVARHALLRRPVPPRRRDAVEHLWPRSAHFFIEDRLDRFARCRSPPMNKAISTWQRPTRRTREPPPGVRPDDG